MAAIVLAWLALDSWAVINARDVGVVQRFGKKTRVMICAKGGSSNVSRVQQLRDAAKRIAADPTLSEETRSRITVAINEAIAKLPASE